MKRLKQLKAGSKKQARRSVRGKSPTIVTVVIVVRAVTLLVGATEAPTTTVLRVTVNSNSGSNIHRTLVRQALG